jgi:hypothetical protein
MLDANYEEKLFDSLVGKSVRDLWKEYKSELENGDGDQHLDCTKGHEDGGSTKT